MQAAGEVGILQLGREGREGTECQKGANGFETFAWLPEEGLRPAGEGVWQCPLTPGPSPRGRGEPVGRLTPEPSPGKRGETGGPVAAVGVVRPDSEASFVKT